MTFLSDPHAELSLLWCFMGLFYDTIFHIWSLCRWLYEDIIFTLGWTNPLNNFGRPLAPQAVSYVQTEDGNHSCHGGCYENLKKKNFQLMTLRGPQSSLLLENRFLTDRKPREAEMAHASAGTSLSLDINDCTMVDPSVKLVKFADDTMLIGLISYGD